MIALILLARLSSPSFAAAAPPPAMSIPEGVSAEWAIGPAEARKAGAEVTLSADPDGRVWLLAGHRALFIPEEDVVFRTDRPVQQVAWLGRGQIARSYSAIGRFQYDQAAEVGMPRVRFRPVASIPLQSWRMSPAGDHEVYLAGYNPRVKRWQVARTSMGHVDVLFQTSAKVSDIAGDGDRFFFSCGRTIWVQERSGDASVYFVHPRVAIRRILASPSGGVFYSTDEGVGFAGEKGGFDFLRASRSQIALGGVDLFVMPGSLSGGVLRIKGLDRFAAVLR